MTVGERAPTRESARHVRGRGRFVADYRPPGMLHVAMVRSPIPHGRIVAVDTTPARVMPGVADVLTGADVAAQTSPAFTLAALHDPPLPIPVWGLAHDRVRHVGDPVAAVAAATRAQAEDAAERVAVELEQLPAVLDAESALADDAALVHDGIAGNRIMSRRYAFGDVDAAFARATHVVRRRVSWSRHAGVALDTFGCVVEWDPASDEVTLHSNLHSFAFVWTLGPTLGLPPPNVRAIACDIGGSFGAKFWQPRPIIVCALLSRRTGRPVRFVEDRAEHLEAGDNHGEDRVYDGELALDADGRMLGLRLRHVEDFGWAFVLGAVGISEPLAQAVGPYRIDAVGVDFTGVLTHKTAQAAYRGFGGAALNFVLERLVDGAAGELAMSRIELRRRNLIAPEQMPYRTPTGNTYDSGDYSEALRRALAAADHDAWREARARARAQGRALGIGIATCQERSVQGGGALWLMYDQNRGRPTTAAETATCRIDAQGGVRVALHSPSLGTAMETVAATVAGHELGVAPEAVSVSRLDTASAGPALGATASRLTVMLAGAVAGAVSEVVEAMRPLAADELEAAPEDLVWDRGECSFVVRGSPGRGVGLAKLAARANAFALDLPPGMRSGLESTYTYDHPTATKPSADGRDWGNFAPIVGHAVHHCVVEVDLETGEIAFRAYTVLSDCGTVLNPDGVRGQVLGGVCQGIGCALSEELTYREDGSLVQRDLRSYLVPTSLDMPQVDVHHMETPSPFTWNGVKGVGEGGRMTAPAAVVSGVEDALAPYGVSIDEIPVTPEKVLRWLDAAQEA